MGGTELLFSRVFHQSLGIRSIFNFVENERSRNTSTSTTPGTIS